MGAGAGKSLPGIAHDAEGVARNDFVIDGYVDSRQVGVEAVKGSAVPCVFDHEISSVGCASGGVDDLTGGDGPDFVEWIVVPVPLHWLDVNSLVEASRNHTVLFSASKSPHEAILSCRPRCGDLLFKIAIDIHVKVFGLPIEERIVVGRQNKFQGLLR